MRSLGVEGWQIKQKEKMTDFFEPFILHIQKKVYLDPEEMTLFLAAFEVKKVKKRQYIIQPGFVARHKNYVAKGAVRAYVIGEGGEEHTIQLAIEDWWITDYNSYVYQQPASMFVVALEDSVVLQIDYENEKRLKSSHHKFETIFRIAAERSAAFQQRRIISGLTRTAEERYHDFLERYPEMAQRVPQYVLASYLGMSTEFLSRIRNHKIKKER
jgi:CRP-like cAMP-binding protein